MHPPEKPSDRRARAVLARQAGVAGEGRSPGAVDATRGRANGVVEDVEDRGIELAARAAVHLGEGLGER